MLKDREFCKVFEERKKVECAGGLGGMWVDKLVLPFSSVPLAPP